MDGPRNPHVVLTVLCETELQKCWVKIDKIGNAEFLLDEQGGQLQVKARENARDQTRWASWRATRFCLESPRRAFRRTRSFPISAPSFQ